MGYGYTIEWTILYYDQAEWEWRSHESSGATPDGEYGMLPQRTRHLLNTAKDIFTEKMPTLDLDRKQIYVFHIDDQYLSKQYFDRNAVFAELQRYFNEDENWFKVPEDALA